MNDPPAPAGPAPVHLRSREFLTLIGLAAIVGIGALPP
jgi:hypothetical protein